MWIQLLDAQDVPHWATWQGQDAILDLSGALGAGAVGPTAAPQVVSPAQPSGGPPAGRAGFLFQNNSANPMLLVEIAVASVAASAWTVYPGDYFPPGPGYPVPSGAISVQGSPSSAAGDAFTYREWSNASGE